MAGVGFRSAGNDDIDAVVALVNSAYRGESSKVGWTTEADLLGGQRTDAREVLQCIQSEDSQILLCCDDESLLASVCLERSGDTTFLGMFAVEPQLQGLGLGKQLLAEAERYARERWESEYAAMWVIPCRHELIAYYERRGYERCGKMKPFPQDPQFGIPKVADLQLVLLRKALVS